MNNDICRVFPQICPPTATAVTAATPQVWTAVSPDRERVLMSPALKEYATMMKQVRFEQLPKTSRFNV